MSATAIPAQRRRIDRHRVALHVGALAVLLVLLYPLAGLVATSFKPAD